MKIRATLLAAASALALTAGLVAPAGAAAPPPTNVANESITCNSIVGTIKFNPGLTLYSGPVDTTPAGTVAVKTTISDCTTTVAGPLVLSGGAAGTLTSAHSSCNGLSGLSTGTSGPLITKWKTSTLGTKITPTASTLNITQTFGTEFNGAGPAGNTDSWGGTYGMFQVGSDAGHGSTSNPNVTGAFTGGNSGHTTTLDVTTGQTTNGIALTCLTSTVKALNFGIGGATLD